VIGLALLALLAQDGFFEERVAPILAKRCLACHNNELDDGDISFENRETLVRKREEKGPAVIPGDPEGSPLVRALRHDGDVQMPPGKKLPQVEIDVLIEWIRRGALWGAKGK
jgi:hypothetical protein